MIERGYERRHRHLWSSARWQTYRLMEVQIGTEGMRKANLDSPKDLLPFPWDRHEECEIDEGYVNEMQELIRSINENNEKGDG